MTEVVWTLRVEILADEIYRRLEENSPDAGERFLEEIDSELELIKRFPEIGRVFRKPIRRRVFGRGRYRLFYVPENRGIVVTGVLDLRQEPELIRRFLGLK